MLEAGLELEGVSLHTLKTPVCLTARDAFITPFKVVYTGVVILLYIRDV